MDRERFDALTRLLATAGSRRAALGALLTAGLLGRGPDVLAKPRQRKRKDKDRNPDRRGGSRPQTEGRGQNRQRRKKTKKRRGGQGGDGGQEPEPLAGVCCDSTKPCAPPEPGSPRAGCDFSERDFSGQNHNGSIFRDIDGRDTTFDGTDNHGSIFAGACLRRASFRGANLQGTTWRGACLFGADFTGADLGGDSAAFAGAIFCATVMPDGSRNDRDCERSDAFPCCLPPPGGGGGGGGQRCTDPDDCPDETCQFKACGLGTCRYEPVADGHSPNGLCDGHCCRGACCAPGATRCNPSGQCCAPNCAGRQCGPDGCGGNGTCGTCPRGVCNDRGRCDACNSPADCPDRTCQTKACTNAGVCVYTPVASGPSPDGRCATRCCRGACCPAGAAQCSRDGACCTPDCAGRECGPDGCGTGGTCGPCSPGQQCILGLCQCNRSTCLRGCCSGRACLPGTAHDNCGASGGACVACDPGMICSQNSDGGECRCFKEFCEPAGGLCLFNNCLCSDSICNPLGGICRDNACVCDPRNCAANRSGCCGSEPGNPSVCLPGNTVQNCGSGGGACRACASGEGCVNGVCVACSPACPPGRRCNANNRCICDEQSCPDGCCAEDGSCQPSTLRTCGLGGQPCVRCNDARICEDGQCVACAGNCTCMGQSRCTTPSAPNVICKSRPGFASCKCMVSRAGQPICASNQVVNIACNADADCQRFIPGGFCVNAAPGGDCDFDPATFCTGPCPL